MQRESVMVRPVVIIKQGWLRGAETKSEVGGSFISFKGIPFAEPPVGHLRFKDPQPPQPWTGVRQAVKEGSQCIQLDDFSHEIEGDEDCLYLNVATTSLEGSRPVMVWIHGGGFIWGNGGSSLYSPDYLMKMGVVFVSFNYRLGVFGFLSLEHEAAPGNIGLKDQVAALKWVKENIAQFGGDPNNVTIFGESAGSGSVHFHLLSPLSKGLFHKAIAQSGVALNPWAQVFATTDIAHRLVANLGRETTDPNEIVEYLRTIPAHKLADAQRNLLTLEETVTFGFAFGPSVDSKSEEPFLPRPARELIADCHDVPLMLGYNSHEGTIFLRGFTDEAYPLVDQQFEVLVSRGLVGLSSSELTGAVKEIRKFYFGDKRITKDVYDEYIQCIGDYFFVAGIHEVVDTRVRTKSPTYLYRFAHNAPKKLSTTIWKTEFEGTGHFDDIAYLFYPAIFPDITFLEPGSVEQVISDRFLRMWTDFAKTGNPTPRLDDLITAKWEPITRSTKNYMAIGEKLSAEVNPNEEIWRFWKRFITTANNQ